MIYPEFPGGLSAIADRYDAILCDVWGVIHNGRHAFSEACEALIQFREQGGAVILITNAPVPKQQVVAYFAPIGVPDEAFDDCVSSGDATRNVLSQRTEQTFWLLGVDEGWERDQHLYDGLGLNFGEADKADTILCMGLNDQVNDDPEDYRPMLAEAARRNMEMVCANPDIKVRVGDRLVWCAGALAQIYESEGGSVIYPGKPHPPIYELALENLSGLGLSCAPERMLCIGDSPATDMRGALKMGFDGLYVGSGLQEHRSNFQQEVRDLLDDYKTTARWAMPFLTW